MNINDLKSYKILEQREISDLNSGSFLLKHIKSGAKIAILSNDDDNKVFAVGFRTPPPDSTGVPHILEHSVLCGSRKYPSKDPFVELVKGSLNTFLNAMTYPDKTVYPVASCNEKDFQNLMDVYMDAVFFPNIYEKEEIFWQEGWHYELETPEAELKYNGVVYNEMKGAFSSPDEVLEREILNSVFPDTPYGNESGGDPAVIPDLTYQGFLDFHKKYYHPSNCYIYLYGNMDIAEKLDWLDREYLSLFDESPVGSELPLQQPFERFREVNKEYSIAANEETADNAYLSYNAVAGTSLNKEQYLAFKVLDYALISAPGAPVKQALLDAGIGKEIIGSFDGSVLQPVFSIYAKKTNAADKERFISIVRDVLQGLVKDGIDKKALQAGIHFYEFRYREGDYGHYPKGLMYGLQMFDSWLYDDDQPFLHIESLKTFDWLKKQTETRYFEELITKYLLDNTHGSIVVVEPKKGLGLQREKELEAKLKKYKESLSSEQIEAYVENTKKLREFQERPSTKEELEKIPMLDRSDIGKEAQPLLNKELELADTKVIHHEMFTNGIAYMDLLFDAKEIPEELISYLGILKAVLGYVDTKRYTYGGLFNEINANLGGIYTTVGIYADVDDREKYKFTVEVKTKALYEKMGFAFEMIKEILFSSKLDDTKRLQEIISELKSRLSVALSSSGHSSAVTRCLSYVSPTSRLSDMISGISFYRLLEDLEANFEQKKDQLTGNLKQLVKLIFRPENLMVSYTSDQQGIGLLEKELNGLRTALYTDAVEKGTFVIACEKKNEGFKTSSQVQYVAAAGNFKEDGREYTGALKILKVILSYDYLWSQIRVQGGAYGCMCGFGRNGDTYFVSYRDPNLGRTVDVYKGIVDYVKGFDADDRDMTKYIIGTVSDMDTPMNPSAKGARSMSAYLSGISFERIQTERDQVLGAGQEDIRRLAEIIAGPLQQGYICVIGNEDRIEQEKELFLQLENL